MENMESIGSFLTSVKIGNFKDSNMSKIAVEGLRGVSFGFGYSNIILYEGVKTPDIAEIVLIVVTPLELGLTGQSTFEQIVNKAQSFGLYLCPEEAAFQTVLQGKVHWTEILDFASNPIRSSRHEIIKYFMSVRKEEEGLSLGVKDYQPHYEFHPGWKFVFCRYCSLHEWKKEQESYRDSILDKIRIKKKESNIPSSPIPYGCNF